MWKPSFTAAMCTYAVLALIAAFELEGKIRLVVWILLAGLAAKTWIARRAGW